ncbi:TonB-dependent receptor [Acetobacter cibinongensis]|uniref:TonB-dependent receptor n=1 Tax=Acetobacter cibinongensis TaxID=146475 RepID=A0A0D6N3J1_9PROT|nr:TonB-dependent receptor [Acetobacter cibinongensis]GAN60143.1 TonB-dependent receptor [Acetobacter cibinongensis]GBQ17890.1 TonB-dependent receptor [Acetobacter cibinongensis NRIC 0482]GEL58361.1 TonB-dependent receptor [Acetobacter cibinongensis]
MVPTKTQHGRFVAAILSSTILFCDYGYAATHKQASRKGGVPTNVRKTSHSVAPQRVRHPSGPVKSRAGEEIMVAVNRAGGGGMMRHETAPRAVQTVTKRYIAMQNPTSTALDLVKNLPSVSVSANDSSGILGGTMNIRSLTDSDMGILLNGVPVATAYYLNQNVDSENLDHVSVTPGSAAINLPVTTAAAGVMDAGTITPDHKFGGTTDFSYGSNNMSREFLRVNSGDIGNSGVRGYLSFSHEHARNWIGPGTNERRHLDFGARKDFDNGSYIDLFASWNHQFTSMPLYPTAQQFLDKKHGNGTFTYSAEYNPKMPSRYVGLVGNMWDQFFITAPVHVVLPSRFSFDFKPYYVYNGGYSYNGSLFNADKVAVTQGSNGAALSGQVPATSTYSVYRPHAGAVAQLNYQIDRHNTVSLGYWFDYQDNQVNNLYSVATEDGRKNYPYAQGTGLFQNGSRYMPYQGDAGWYNHSLFVHNVSRYFDNRLQVDAGFKVSMINRYSQNYASRAPHMQENTVVPLPQLGIGYKIDEHNQIYINAEGDYRMPDPGSLSAVFDAQSGSYVGNPYNAKPQYLIKEELGWRFNNSYLMADLSFFNYSITNRLVSTSVYVNNQAISTTINAGNQTARGFDAMVAAHPIHHFSPYASIEYLNTSMDSNLPTTGLLNGATVSDLLPTKGRRAVMAPHVLANIGLTYDDGKLFGNFAVHYTSAQYTTFMNDEKMPGYFTDSIAVGYRFPSFGFVKAPVFRMNFNNITGSFVRTGAYGLTNNAHATTGVYGSAVSASGSPTYYLYPRFNMTGTLSVSF